MKTILRITILILVISSLMLATPALAQDMPSNSAEETDNIEYQVSFAMLGESQPIFLQGPLKQASIPFSLPPEWVTQPGAVLHIEATTLISNFMVGQEIPNLETINTGKVSIWLNGILLGSDFLQGSGQHILEYAIPENALQAHSTSGLNELLLEWDATSSCDQNIAASISIAPISYLYLPHEQASPATSLEIYPSPFYQHNNPLAHPVTLVIPDSATQAVMQGAIQIATSLGRTSQGEIQFNVVTESKLDKAKYSDSHLILVGGQDAFNTITSQAPTAPNVDDGILHIFKSPWNEKRLVMAVLGANDQAVLKAASALSSGQVLSASSPETAFINSPFSPGQPIFKQDQSFADLGAGPLYFQSFGTSKQTLFFNIPSGKSIGADAYLDLVFNHSQLIDYLRSGIQVRLNNVPVGSIRLSDASSNLNQVRLIIPASAIQTGGNHLELQVDITPRSACSDSRQGSLYVTILPDSFLHLPLTDAPIINSITVGLDTFPAPFSSQELNSTTFILPSDDPASWSTAVQLAFILGTPASGLTFPGVIFATEGQNPAFTGNAIVIGQPGRAPAIAALASAFPMPFDSSGQLTTEAQARLSYKLDATRSTGYIEMATVPEQPESAILLIAGNNDQGLSWAGNVLSQPQLRKSMQGDNFAVAQSNSSVKSENIQIAGAENGQEPGLPGTKPSPGELAGGGQNIPARQDLWILPTLITALLGLIGLIAWEVFSWRKTR